MFYECDGYFDQLHLCSRTRDELAEILELLKAQIDPALLTKKETLEDLTGTSPHQKDEDVKNEAPGGAYSCPSTCTPSESLLVFSLSVSSKCALISN